MHICIIYDCLYPWTIGGAERWYRLLAESLVQAGHHVTYLTMDQWSPGPAPAIPGVEVIAVAPSQLLYVDGRRAIIPTLSFGSGVLRHLAACGGRYDTIACASFPFFSTLAAARMQRRGGYRLVVDWWEVWTDDYWKRYLGASRGRVGAAVQRACARSPHVARTASHLHASRLRALGFNGQIHATGGLHTSKAGDTATSLAESYIVVIGRHTADKGVQHVVPALVEARRELPDLRAVILGDGPLRQQIHEMAAREGIAHAVDLPGFTSEDVRDGIIQRALGLLNPSTREGLGLAVLDAASRGVPSIVVRAPDNAAMELIEPGVNGVIAMSTDAEDLASAILSIHRAGPRLRGSTLDWWTANRPALVASDGIRRAIASYTDG